MRFKFLKGLLILISGIIFLITFLAIFSQNVNLNLPKIFDSTTDRQFLISQFRTIGPLSFIAFIIILAIVSAIPGFPNSIVAITAGIYFGPWLGSCLNLIGLVAGSVLSVSVIQLTYDFKEKRTIKRNRVLNDLLQMKHKKIGLTIGYAVPFIPTVLTNLAAVKLKTKLPVIFTCALIGSLPSAVIYSFCGNSLLSGNYKQSLVIISIILILALLLVFIRYDRKEQQKMSRG
ncbi:VTT domain-containing protein [Liquorilactobacillus sicerae]|uniref:VTT domain-containing protein n=1 Tax=Liquorilactobacillus sicerae TaxID=1416943 RepID=UPI00248050DA|nr:VTT domain-containing protein [Liquorilactobacillus sicerae]